MPSADRKGGLLIPYWPLRTPPDTTGRSEEKVPVLKEPRSSFSPDPKPGLIDGERVPGKSKTTAGCAGDHLEHFLTGSYSRSPMIAPLKEADVNIFIVLGPKYFYNYDNGQNGGQAGLLDLLKRTLRKTYTRTLDISRNGQAVTIRFSFRRKILF